MSQSIPIKVCIGDLDHEQVEQLYQYLADSHSHPQLDPQNLQTTTHLRAQHVAAMGVAVNVDWGHMDELAQIAGTPCSSPNMFRPCIKSGNCMV